MNLSYYRILLVDPREDDFPSQPVGLTISLTKTNTRNPLSSGENPYNPYQFNCPYYPQQNKSNLCKIGIWFSWVLFPGGNDVNIRHSSLVTKAVTSCPELQRITTLESALPVTHIQSLTILKHRHFYVANILPRIFAQFVTIRHYHECISQGLLTWPIIVSLGSPIHPVYAGETLPREDDAPEYHGCFVTYP